MFPKTITYNDVLESALAYFNNDELAATTWMNKYAMKNKKGEYLESSPDEMHKRMAAEFGRIEQKYLGKEKSKEGLSDYGKSGDYVARQVSRWTKQYIASETKNIESMNKLIEWLPKNIPANDQTSIVHGDFRLDNIVFSQNNVLGVLDWELSTLGHPIADFNYHCLNWRNLPELQDEKFCKRSGIPTEKEYLAMYCENTGNDISYDWDFYYIFNIFKLAGILQGIMGRVRDGTAASKHAEERSDQIVPLADAAWDLVKKNYL